MLRDRLGDAAEHRTGESAVSARADDDHVDVAVVREADELVCDVKPAFLRSVGEWYSEFSPITDGEVRNLLARAADIAA